jgi:hypothetical protein
VLSHCVAGIDCNALLSRARSSCVIAINSTPMPRAGITLRTMARARTSPNCKSINTFTMPRIDTGFGVTTNNPPSAMLSMYDTDRRVPDCHATTALFGATARG